MANKKIKLELPLPPSVNAVYIFVPRLHRFVFSKEAQNYEEDAILIVRDYSKRSGKRMINENTPVYLEMYLRRKNSDCHNYFKILFDALQKGELFEDDRYIMPRVMKLGVNTKNPHIVLWI